MVPIVAVAAKPGPAAAGIAAPAAADTAAPAAADSVAPAVTPPRRLRVTAAAVALGNSRARLRKAVLARLGALSAAVGEPMAFHVMGACLSVVDKSPLNAPMEPLSLWVSAVLQIGWALMGSGATVAPCHLWQSSVPILVQESAVDVLMNWVGGCSVSLPFHTAEDNSAVP